MPETLHIWERQDAESAKAYSAFVVYRDMGLERSIDAAYRGYVGDEKSRKEATGHFKRWASKHDWLSRAKAYDAERERERLREHGTAEIEAFRDSQIVFAKAAKEAARGLLIKASRRMGNMSEVELKTMSIKDMVACFRAAAAVGEAATNAEATAIGAAALMEDLADRAREDA